MANNNNRGKGNRGYKPNNGSKDFRENGDQRRSDDRGCATNGGKRGKREEKPNTQRFSFLDDLRTNDPRYWNKEEGLYTQSTKVAWDAIFGNKVDWNSTIPDNLANTYKPGASAFPAIMVYNHIAVPGWAKDATDPVNKCFTSIMADLYAKTNASSLPFQQADIALLCTSMCSIISMIAHAKKVLAGVQFWNSRNINYPRAFMQACGFNYRDIMTNRFQYLQRLTAIVLNFNIIQLPKFLDIFEREYALNHAVWVDEDSPFGQVYTVKPYAYYKYVDAPKEGTPAYAELRQLMYYGDDMPLGSYDNVDSFSKYLDVIEGALNAWMHSSDLYYIKGALGRAYGYAETFGISVPQVDELINPVPDDYILLQIMNARFTQMPASLDTWKITQDPEKDLLIFTPNTLHKYGDQKRLLLRIYKMDPTADDNMEMTRFMSVGNGAGELHCGTDVIVNAQVVVFDRSTDFVRKFTIGSNILDIDLVPEIDASQLAIMLEDALVLQNFRYVPTIEWVIKTADSTAAGVLGDIYNYTTVTRSAIEALNTAALYSIYHPLAPKL